MWSAKKLWFSVKEPYKRALYGWLSYMVYTMSYISTKEPYVSAKQPCNSAKAPCKRALHGIYNVIYVPQKSPIFRQNSSVSLHKNRVKEPYMAGCLTIPQTMWVCVSVCARACVCVCVCIYIYIVPIPRDAILMILWNVMYVPQTSLIFLQKSPASQQKSRRIQMCRSVLYIDVYLCHVYPSYLTTTWRNVYICNVYGCTHFCMW